MGHGRKSNDLLKLVTLTDRFEGCSPSNLNYARTHEELAHRKPRPINEGCSIREALMTDDYYNWE